ncbi:MAG: ABC transporter substrate-binding protein [Candidatus Rokubacteria bacterium]|nr:ABC transporter substrate-binding protein [Candidatus Rokubacteria bacterium]
MRLRTVVLVALGILATPLSAGAQQPGRVPRIGILLPGSPPTPATPLPTLEAFLQGLRDLGYVEGRNVALEYRWAEGKLDPLSDLAAELVRLKVDVIVTHTAPAIQAAKKATSTVPIVMAAVGDPVVTGLVASLARPGGNITGLSLLAPELAGKRLELLKETLPKLSRVAVLWNSASPAMVHTFRQALVAAETLGVKFQSLEVQGDPTDFERAFSAITRERPDGLFVTLDPFTSRHRGRIAELAAKHRVPAMYELREFVDAGGLMAYGPSSRDLWRRAATYVDKILKGAKPADLPVEQPTKFELVVNLKTAKALGLTIPQSVLIRADHVIQ